MPATLLTLDGKIWLTLGGYNGRLCQVRWDGDGLTTDLNTALTGTHDWPIESPIYHRSQTNHGGRSAFIPAAEKAKPGNEWNRSGPLASFKHILKERMLKSLLGRLPCTYGPIAIPAGSSPSSSSRRGLTFPVASGA
jgi:hypothetical protein